MTDEQVTQVVQAIDRQTLSITTAILMSGWVPDDMNRVMGNERIIKAVYTARAILHDAVSTAEAGI